MAHASVDDTPPEALAKLVENCRTRSGDTIKAVLFGINANYTPGPPSNHVSRLPYRVGPYKYQLTWGEHTGDVLQAIVDDISNETTVRAECTWLLKAWIAWQSV